MSLAEIFKRTPPDPAEEKRLCDRIRIRDEVVRLKYEKRGQSQKSVGRIEVIARTGLTYEEIEDALGQSLESWANSGQWVVDDALKARILSGNAAGVEVTQDRVLMVGRVIAIDEGLRNATLRNVAVHLGPSTLSAVTQIGQTDRILQGMIGSRAAEVMRTSRLDAVVVAQAIAERHRAVSLVSLDDRRYVCVVMAEDYTPE